MAELPFHVTNVQFSLQTVLFRDPLPAAKCFPFFQGEGGIVDVELRGLSPGQWTKNAIRRYTCLSISDESSGGKIEQELFLEPMNQVDAVIGNAVSAKMTVSSARDTIPGKSYAFHRNFRSANRRMMSGRCSAK